MQLGLRRMARDIGLTFLRQFAGALIQLGIILLIARELGPEGAGGYAVALLLPQIMTQVLNLGMAPANVYFLASRRFDLRQIWPPLRDATITLAVLGLCVGMAFVSLAGEAAFPGIAPALLMLALAVLPFSFSLMMVQSLFQALQDFRTFNVLVLVQPIIALALLALLWVVDRFTLGPIILATALAYAVALAVGLAALVRHTPLWSAARDRGNYLRPAIRYGIQAHLSNITAFLNYRLDLFLVNFFLGPAAAGLYSVAVRLAEQLWMLSQAVSTVLLPRLASLNNEEDTRRTLTPIIARFVLWLTLFGAGALAALAQPLIALLFGSEFIVAATALFLLLPGVVLKASSRVLANDLAARGLVGINLALGVFVLVVNTLGNLLLIPSHGIAGAAIATSLASVLDFALRLVIHQRITETRWWRFVLVLPEDIQRLKSALRRKRWSNDRRMIP